MSEKTYIRPNIVIVGRVEKETVGVKSNYKDVVAYARGLIDKHFVAKEESFYIVKAYGDFYYYEIHEGGDGKAYLPSIMRIVDDFEKDCVNDDSQIASIEGGGSDNSMSAKIKKLFHVKGKVPLPSDPLINGKHSDDTDDNVLLDTLYIKGNIKCSKIKFNGNNMVFSFASESENQGIKTTNGIQGTIGMTPYFSDLNNIKNIALVFFILSVLFFMSAVAFREFGFRERVFYVKGEQVINVPQFIEKTIRGVGIADDEYVEKVVYDSGKWVVKKRKIEQKKKPEKLDEMLENKTLLEDGVNAIRTKALR